MTPSDVSTSRAAQVERAIYLRWFLGPDAGAATADITSLAQEVAFRKGEHIYEQGDASEAIYLMIEGTVELSTPQGPSWYFHARDGVGFIDAMIGRARARTAVASSYVRALRLDFDDWMDLLEDNFHLTRTAVLNQARALHEIASGLAPDGGHPAPAASQGRGAASLVDLLAALRANPLFSKASMQALVVLGRQADTLELEAGALAHGDASATRTLLLVTDGIVETRSHDSRVVARFGPGQLVGGLAPLIPGTPGLEARALAPARIARIREEDFFDVMEDHFDVARSALSFVAAERERLLLTIEARGGRTTVHD